MKVVVVCPTLNEERNIKLFCERHQFCDEIIISDGGSTDRTVEIASRYKNVTIHHFKKQTLVANGPEPYRNPEGEHFNFVTQLGYKAKPDWIVWDSCDQFPNKALEADAREIMATTPMKAIFSHRVNMWGKDQYFPKMMPLDWRTIWAWKPSVKITFPKVEYHAAMEGVPTVYESLNLPYTLMHNLYPDAATVKLKLDRYNAWGVPQIPPHEWCYAPAEPMLGWMLDNRNW